MVRSHGPSRIWPRRNGFYRDVLRLPHLFTAGKLAFFDCGGVRLMIEDRSIIEVPDLHNDSVLYFRVPDIHAAQQELERRGATFTGAPHMIYRRRRKAPGFSRGDIRRSKDSQ